MLVPATADFSYHPEQGNVLEELPPCTSIKQSHSSPFTCGFTLHDEHRESAESAVQLEADSDTGHGEGVRRLWICQREVSISSAIYFPA